ncbi:MAG: molybdopterin-dependent oxidoreductase [Candidatus Korobacteraceae bacterium]|jgi:anaerobic selenocysteine-containing dehydrogenase
MKRIVRTVCQECHSECGVLVQVEEGKVTSIKPDPEHPASRGCICVKGVNYARFASHPQRVKYPMRRAGEKGEGKWERISWDEALDGIAAKLTALKEQHGVRSIGTFHGTAPRQALFFSRLLASAMGTPNVINTDLHICYAPSMVGEFATYGASVMQEQGPDYLSSKCILVCGGNPTISHPARGRDLMDGVKKNQAKLIVIDPRRTKLAAQADHWFQIRPGTDLALILGMLHTIITEDLYDWPFVEQYCHGFEELRKRVEAYPPEWAAAVTWLSADQIKEAARLFARSKPAVVHHRVAVEQNLNSTQTVRALADLIAITGNLGVQGGNLLPTPVPGFVSTGGVMGFCKLPPEMTTGRLSGEEYPLIAGQNPLFLFVHPALAAKAALHGSPYPLKAVLLAGGNPVVNMQNTKRTWEAFKSLDCLVVLDFFMTPTAELADYVLPATTWLERDDCCDEPYLNCIAARQKAIEPPPECRDDVQIAIDLVRRLPWANRKYLPWESTAEFNDFRVRGMGMTFEEFKQKGYVSPTPQYRQYKEKGVNTPTGKIELFSTIFDKYGYEALPVYVEPPQSPVSTPELLKDYPYILVTGGRTIEYYLSSGRQIEPLRKRMPDPLFEMHPETARQEKLEDGDWVWVETPLVKGERVRLRVKTTTDFDPRVVHAQHGWWFPENAAPDHGCFESNINAVLTDDPPREPICGSVPLRGTLCRFYACDAKPRTESTNRG